MGTADILVRRKGGQGCPRYEPVTDNLKKHEYTIFAG
jgi:hypothetical protein